MRMPPQMLQKRLLTEDEFLQAVEDIYRAGGYDVTTVHGAVRVSLPRERLEREFTESPYLEAGSARHLTENPVA